VADLIHENDLQAIGTAAAKETRERVQRLKLQHAVLIAAIGVLALAAGMYARPWAWKWPRPEPGPAWSFELGTRYPADTAERWILTVRSLPEGKPGWFPKEGPLIVRRNTAVRLYSPDLARDLSMKIRRGSKERVTTFARQSVVTMDWAYYTNVNPAGDAEISFWITGASTLTIDVLRTPPGELEKDIIARKGTIDVVR
jgi:hypothetical protein